jgi:hypothetical protein
MEDFYLCSIQSKIDPNQNKTVLVPVNEISDFISYSLRSDCLILVSSCSTFNSPSDEK